MTRKRRARWTGLLVGCALLGAGLATAAETYPVDDFEDGDLESAAGLSWILFTDRQYGGESDGRLELLDGGAGGSRHALRIVGNPRGEGRAFVSAFGFLAPGGLPVDLSGYSGVRFWARGDGGEYVLRTHRLAVQDFNEFRARFVAPERWARIEIPFSSLAQDPDAGKRIEWSAGDLMYLFFHNVPGRQAPFRLDVDDVEFYRSAPGAAGVPGRSR